MDILELSGAYPLKSTKLGTAQNAGLTLLALTGVLPLQSIKLGTAQNAGLTMMSLTGVMLPDLSEPGVAADAILLKTRTSSWRQSATQSQEIMDG